METHFFTMFSDTSITAEGKLGDQEGWGERGWRGSGVEGGNGPGVEEIEFAAKYKSQLPTPTLGREEEAFPPIESLPLPSDV